MYLRESSTPKQDAWEALFDVDLILDRFCMRGELAELGCGYGTFTLPLARHTTGTVHAIDIDRAMVDTVRRRVAVDGITNIDVQVRCDNRGVWPPRLALRCVPAIQYSARPVACFS